MDIKSLNEEIQDEFNKLKEMETGSDKYRTTVDGLTKLIDRKIELQKVDIECEEKAKNRELDREMKLKQIEAEQSNQELDRELKRKQMEDEEKDRFIRNCITVAGIVIPSVITVWGTIKSIKFEEEGTITTIMGRGFINKLLPKK